MACNCGNVLASWGTGNNVLIRFYLYEGNPRQEFTVDVYDSWSLRALRDGVVNVQGVERGLDENNRIVVKFPSSMTTGKYAIEIETEMNGFKRRAMVCGIIEVVDCDQQANVPTTMVGGDVDADIDVRFQIIQSAYAQGMNQYEIWKMSNPDGTLQEYIELISQNPKQAEIDRINGDIQSLQRVVQRLDEGKLGWRFVDVLPDVPEQYSEGILFFVPTDELTIYNAFVRRDGAWLQIGTMTTAEGGTASVATSFDAVNGMYYYVGTPADEFHVNLPEVSRARNCHFKIWLMVETSGGIPIEFVPFNDEEIYYQRDANIFDNGGTYEIDCLWNGFLWRMSATPYGSE